MGNDGSPYNDLMTVPGALIPANLNYGFQCILTDNNGDIWEDRDNITSPGSDGASLSTPTFGKFDIEANPGAGLDSEGNEIDTLSDWDITSSLYLESVLSYYWGVDPGASNKIIENKKKGKDKDLCSLVSISLVE